MKTRSKLESVGRPPSGASPRPKSGKGRQLSANITQRMRDELESEAVATGSSMSQVVELWLEEGRKMRDGVAGVPGAETIRAMIAFGRLIETEIGDPRSNVEARDALLAGWRLLVDRALPHTPDSVQGIAYRGKRRSLVTFCDDINERIQNGMHGGDEDMRPAFKVPEDDSLIEGMHGKYSLARILQAMRDGDTASPTTLALRHRAAEASEASPALEKMLKPLFKLLPPFEKARDKYMQPRKEAVERGEALVDAMRPIDRIEV